MSREIEIREGVRVEEVRRKSREVRVEKERVEKECE